MECSFVAIHRIRVRHVRTGDVTGRSRGTLLSNHRRGSVGTASVPTSHQMWGGLMRAFACTMRTLMRATTIALTAAVATTTTGLIPVPALAVEQGTSITTAPPWAAYVTVVGKYGVQVTEESCTGTIVSDGWVLTAAHCVVKHNKSGAETTTPLPGRAFAIVLGRSNLNKTHQGAQFSVDQVKVDPNFNPGTLANDAALVYLVGTLPATARPLPLAPSGYVIADGQDVTAYGYGNTFEYYKKASSDYRSTNTNTLQVTVAGSYTRKAVASRLSRRIGASPTMGHRGDPARR